MRKNKLFLAPLALCACVGAAFADDSSVTLYGVLDAGIAQVQHTANFDPNFVVGVNPTNTKVNGSVNGGSATASAPSATGMFNGGLSATRWGIKGQEDLGGGVKAVFLLESGFNLQSGAISNAALSVARNTATSGPSVGVDSAISGQLFARGAYAGLSSADYGSLTLGRQQSFFLDNVAVFDPMSGAQLFSPLGFSGSYGGGGFTDDSRADNSLKYKLVLGDFTLGALYKFGGVAGSTSAQGAYQANAVYASGPLALQLGYQQFKDAFSVGNTANSAAVPLGTVTLTAADTKAFMFAAKYALPTDTILKIGYEREEFENPSNPTVDAHMSTIFGQAVAPVTTGTATVPGPYNVNVGAYPNQKKLDVLWFGGSQQITTAFNVSAAAYHVKQNAYGSGAAAGCSNTSSGTCSGTQNYYSLIADYRLSKRTDVYGGAMLSRVAGGPAAGFVDTSNRVIGFGLRHTF